MVRISGQAKLFFFRFPSLFFSVYLHLNNNFYHCRYFKNDFMTLLIIYFFAYAHTFTISFFAKLNYFKKSDRLSENPAPLYTTLNLGRKRFGFIYVAQDSHSSGDSEDSVVPNSQMNIVCNVLHQSIF